jgi:hypothetical protein
MEKEWGGSSARDWLVLVFAHLSARQLSLCRGVCKLWHRAGMDPGLWQSHLQARWPRIVLPPGRKVDLCRLYRERSVVKDGGMAIENCAEALFSFRCPYAWSELQPTNDKSVRHCEICNRSVFLSRSIEEFSSHVSNGNCTALLFRWAREGRYECLMGEGDSKDVTVIMQLLRDNLTLWSGEGEEPSK